MATRTSESNDMYGGIMKDREKEINHLIYLKEQLIRQTKKEIKELQQEKNMINGYKTLERRKGNERKDIIRTSK